MAGPDAVDGSSADIGQDAIFGATKVAINGGLHLYSSLPEREQCFARKCLNYRDMRIGNPEDSKNRLGDIFCGRTPAKLPLASFTPFTSFRRKERLGAPSRRFASFHRITSRQARRS